MCRERGPASSFIRESEAGAQTHGCADAWAQDHLLGEVGKKAMRVASSRRSEARHHGRVHDAACERRRDGVSESTHCFAVAVRSSQEFGHSGHPEVSYNLEEVKDPPSYVA